MSHPEPRILAFAGSTRTQSYNKRLVQIAAQGAQTAGVQVTLLDLRDFAMPLYDGDLEEQAGLPEAALRFKKLLLEHQGLLIASPEYNSGYSGVLKNAIDWASRPVEGEAPLACFNDKICAIMSASPGGLGGLRGLTPLRLLLSNINVVVLPKQVAIAQAHQAFNEAGQLIDPKQQASVEALGQQVAAFLKRV